MCYIFYGLGIKCVSPKIVGEHEQWVFWWWWDYVQGWTIPPPQLVVVVEEKGLEVDGEQ